MVLGLKLADIVERAEDCLWFTNFRNKGIMEQEANLGILTRLSC